MELPGPTTLASVAGASAGVTAVVTLAKPAAIGAAKLLEALLGKPVEVAGGMLADTVYGWQIANRINVAVKVKEKLDAAGVEPKAVAPDFLLPYLEAVGNVSNPDLQDLWAALLSSVASDATKPHPLYIHVLTRMSPEDAQFFKIWSEKGNPKRIWQGDFYITASRLVALGLVNIIPTDSPDPEAVQYVRSDFAFEFADAIGLKRPNSGLKFSGDK